MHVKISLEEENMKKTLSVILSVILALSLFLPCITSYGQVDLEVTAKEAGKTNIVAGQVLASPGEIVKFPVYILNNTGYAATGLRLIYAEGLTPNLNASEKLITQKGDAGDDVTITFSYNTEHRIIGNGTMGAEGEYDSGLFYTVEIKVPENASGTYPMTLEVERWLNTEVQPVSYVTVDGFIQVSDSYEISAEASPGDGGTISGTGTYDKDKTAVLTASPAEGYRFLRWEENGYITNSGPTYSFTVTGKRHLVAVFDKVYNIKFQDDEGNELQKKELAYGETPRYTGNTPVKTDPDGIYSYTFAGWSPEITSVTDDATYTATFTWTYNDFEIKFVNEDGTLLQTKNVTYGQTPEYTGDTPAKEPLEGKYTYDFAGWTPGIASVTGTATYTAKYTEVPVNHKVTFKVDGEVYKELTVPYGKEITAPGNPEKDYYTFSGWDNDIPDTMPGNDLTFNALFTAIEYKATFVDENGNTVAQVPYTVESEKIDEPAVPEKEEYNGAWEEYELTPEGITVKPVYTPANICKLDGEYHGGNTAGKILTFLHNLIYNAFSFIGLKVFFSIKRG